MAVQDCSYLIAVDEMAQSGCFFELFGAMVYAVYLLRQEGKISPLYWFLNGVSLSQDVAFDFILLSRLYFNDLDCSLFLIASSSLALLFLDRFLLNIKLAVCEFLRSWVFAGKLPLKNSLFLNQPRAFVLGDCLGMAKLRSAVPLVSVVLVNPAKDILLTRILLLFDAHLILLPLLLDDAFNVVFYILSDHFRLFLGGVLHVFSHKIKFLDFDLDKMLEESFELGVIKDHFEGILKAVRSLRWV